PVMSRPPPPPSPSTLSLHDALPIYVGAAYYASGRARPIMDAFAYHPYPGSSADSLDKGLPWPNASVANLDRIKQAVWDAFHGTRSEEHTSELQSQSNLVCRLLLEKK